MIGHDGDSIQSWTTENTPNTNVQYQRIKRTWAVTESSTDFSSIGIGVVSLIIDSNLIPPGDDAVGLVFSQSDDFSNADFSVPLFMNADGNYEALVDLRDGDHFTIMSGSEISVGDESVLSHLKEALIYPNPSNDGKTTLYLKDHKNVKTVSLSDIQGRTVREYQLSAGQDLVQIDLEDEASGVYLIRFRSEFGERTMKIVR